MTSTQAGLADVLHRAALAGLDHHWLELHARRVREVTDEEVRAAAARLRPEAYSAVVLGPEPAGPGRPE
jgi:predicted Zn-dependent peptidase